MIILFLLSVAHAWDCKSFKMPTPDELKSKLSDEQYKVMRDEGTERPFKNEYFAMHEDGIFVDRISGEPLFSSKDKYDSGTGWPSFSKPIQESAVTKKSTALDPRSEVRSACSDSHLGHVFNDGPKPTGKRYCMNSASLRFIPKDKLKKEGYGEYAKLFEKGAK